MTVRFAIFAAQSGAERAERVLDRTLVIFVTVDKTGNWVRFAIFAALYGADTLTPLQRRQGAEAESLRWRSCLDAPLRSRCIKKRYSASYTINISHDSVVYIRSFFDTSIGTIRTTCFWGAIRNELSLLHWRCGRRARGCAGAFCRLIGLSS
jgi:hypothetical protein